MATAALLRTAQMGSRPVPPTRTRRRGVRPGGAFQERGGAEGTGVQHGAGAGVADGGRRPAEHGAHALLPVAPKLEQANTDGAEGDLDSGCLWGRGLREDRAGGVGVGVGSSSDLDAEHRSVPQTRELHTGEQGTGEYEMCPNLRNNRGSAFCSAYLQVMRTFSSLLLCAVSLLPARFSKHRPCLRLRCLTCDAETAASPTWQGSRGGDVCEGSPTVLEPPCSALS